MSWLCRPPCHSWINFIFCTSIGHNPEGSQCALNQLSLHMWLRLIVLVLPVVIIIIVILLQQLDDLNALQSPLFIRSSQTIFVHPIMDYPVELENQLICISKIAAPAPFYTHRREPIFILSAMCLKRGPEYTQNMSPCRGAECKLLSYFL